MGQVIARDRLGELTRIGAGGQGVVYRAPNVTTKFAASMVYKEYKPTTLGQIDAAALAAMPALVEDNMAYAAAERLVGLAAWPCALVEDATGVLSGFVMPAIPAEFFIELTTVKGATSTPAEFQHLLNHPSMLAARGLTITDAQRYALLRETASALAFLHSYQVCVGDISPKNLLFGLTPHEKVYFIDCDAMRINATSVLPQVQTPDWEAPAGQELATVDSDTYKLGLLALRLLAGDQATTTPAHLPGTVPAPVRQLITDTLTKPPGQRPHLQAWSGLLGQAIEIAQHQQNAATPAPAALPEPTVPVVHSRPTPGSQRQSQHISTPPSTPPPPVSAPRPSPNRPPAPVPAPAAKSSNTTTWAVIVVGLAVVLVGVVAVLISVLHQSSSSSASSSPTGTQTQTVSTGPSAASYPTATANPLGSAGTPRGVLPDPDQWGDACRGNSNGSLRVGRGTDGTSCSFALNVLNAYASQAPTGSQQTIQVNVASPRTSCPEARANAAGTLPTAIACSGDYFVMTCEPHASGTWIDCRGGNLAEVFIW